MLRGTNNQGVIPAQSVTALKCEGFAIESRGGMYAQERKEHPFKIKLSRFDGHGGDQALRRNVEELLHHLEAHYTPERTKAVANQFCGFEFLDHVTSINRVDEDVRV